MTPIVFDLDGTLIDSLPDIAAAGNALLAEEGTEPLPVADFAPFVGHGEQIFLDRLIAAAGLSGAARPRLLARFLVLYQDAAAGSRLFPGAREALERLGQAGHGLGLCSNKPSAPLEVVLDTVGLRAVFDVVVAGDTLERRKPDPAPLRHCLDVLGGGGVYVGDSEVDAETARRAGVPFVLFTRGIRHGPLEAIPRQADFADFADLPRALRSAGA